MATLFSGGLIFDGNELFEDHAVLVDDGIISRCAPTSEFVGCDAVLVDTSGNTLLPGLFDCHVHLVFSESPDPFQELTKLSAIHMEVLLDLNMRFDTNQTYDG